MTTKPVMTRPQENVMEIVKKLAKENKWSISFVIADILFEVVINKRLPTYLQ